MEYLGGKERWKEYIRRSGLRGSPWVSLAALAPDQQCHARPRPPRTAPPVQDTYLRARRFHFHIQWLRQLRVSEQHLSCQHHQPVGEHRAELVRRRLRQPAAPLFARFEFASELHFLEKPDQRAGFSLTDG